jgi:hypothetical protein
VLHAESADSAARTHPRDGVCHVQTDALLPYHDRPDVGLGSMLDQMIDRIAAENLNPLAFEDLGDGCAKFHDGCPPLMMSIFPIGLTATGSGIRRSVKRCELRKSRMRHAARTEAVRRDCMPKNGNVALTNHRRFFLRDLQNKFVSAREQAIN